MKRFALALTTLSWLALTVYAHPPVHPPYHPTPKDPQPPTPVAPGVGHVYQPRVQIALLLDTSNSMDGLIRQAKIQLWSIVNEFMYARHRGVAPEIQVALYEYGNNRLPAHTGHIRQVLAFTTDLDAVSQALFALSTDGGNEYCGWVLQEALTHLRWDQNAATLKTIFIAGNETFTQGCVDYRISCKAARQQGILINTIHCGHINDGQHGQWDQGAALAQGRFLNINQDQAVVHIPAPQDDEIVLLNERLNQTYVAYGREGIRRKEMQLQEDTNAAQLSPVASLSRAVTKSSSNYQNSHWDLVDAVDQGATLKELPASALPPEMQVMSEAERQTYITAKKTERQDIQTRIQQLQAERRQFLAQAQQGQDESLGEAILQAIRAQAQAQGFIFEKSSDLNATAPRSAESIK